MADHRAKRIAEFIKPLRVKPGLEEQAPKGVHADPFLARQQAKANVRPLARVQAGQRRASSQA
jgi:hypothetical protein